MFKDYEDLLRQMELEMQRCSADAMRCLLDRPSGAQEFWMPRVDVYETENELVARVEVAGVRRESLHVSLSADRKVLSVRGCRDERHIDDRRRLRYYQLEAYFGSFDREIALPHDIAVDAENITAKYRDGFLVISMPKVARSQVARAVPVTAEEA